MQRLGRRMLLGTLLLSAFGCGSDGGAREGGPAAGDGPLGGSGGAATSSVDGIVSAMCMRGCECGGSGCGLLYESDLGTPTDPFISPTAQNYDDMQACVERLARESSATFLDTAECRTDLASAPCTAIPWGGGSLGDAVQLPETCYAL